MILSLQGCMAVGKTTAARYLQAHDPQLHVCFEDNAAVIAEVKHRGLDKNCYADYLEIQPGDTVKFIRKHKSHNAASIAELSPANYPGFMGKIDEEIEVTYDNPGFYGIKCSPHYAQGMVMMIKVGDTTLPDSYRAFKAPGIADKRFQEIYARIDKR